MEPYTEAIQLDRNFYLQASPQKFRLHRQSPFDASRRIEHMMEKADASVVRQLMAGAFYAGFQRTSSSNPDETTASLLPLYIHSLASAYQTTHATPPIMRHAAKRMVADEQLSAAAHCRLFAEQESGHDMLALMDIAALGLPSQEYVTRWRPKNALDLVELFTRYANSDNPIAVLGYAYALERKALCITESLIATIEQCIPADIRATRCLRVHSNAGSEINHVAESVTFIATLRPKDRATIARAIYETVCLREEAPNDYPGDIAMQEMLSEFNWSMFTAVG